MNGSANGVANGGANGSASGNSNGSANGSANGRAVAAADSAAKVAASGSPTRGGVLSSVNIRQIAGSESPVTGSDNQCAVESSAVRRLNSAGVGGLEDEKGGRIGMWAAHWKARALELRQGFQELDIRCVARREEGVMGAGLQKGKLRHCEIIKEGNLRTQFGIHLLATIVGRVRFTYDTIMSS